MNKLYKERLKELSGNQLTPYQVSIENFSSDQQLTKTEIQNTFNNSYIIYARNKRPYKRRVFVQMRSYYLPEFVRGATDCVRNILINAKEYFKKFVLRHEKIHFAHPDWSEELVREFDEFYEPSLPDVELVYV